MATLQERSLGYHSQAGLEPGTSRFLILCLNHYAALGMLDKSCCCFASDLNLIFIFHD
jgi:hypothetical protein